MPQATQRVVRHHALGDVRHRQVGHDPLADHVLTGPLVGQQRRLQHPAQVVVGDHHALGVPGGARRVDDRGQVVGRRRSSRPRPGRAGSAASSAEVSSTPSGRSAGAIEHQDRARGRAARRGPRGTCRGSCWFSTIATLAPQCAGQVLRPGRPTRSCRSTPASRRRTAPRGRASGTRGCCASSARHGRPCRRPCSRRPAAARATRSATSAKVSDCHSSPIEPAQRRAVAVRGDRRRGTPWPRCGPATRASISSSGRHLGPLVPTVERRRLRVRSRRTRWWGRSTGVNAVTAPRPR